MANTVDIDTADIDVIDAELEPSPERPLLLPPGTASPVMSTYLLLPVIFLIVTLLGGLRLGASDNAFIFVRPALICLVLGAVLMVLIFRSRIVTMEGWLSHDLPPLANIANALI